MHFFKSKKFIVMIAAAVMMTSLGMTANAQTLLDETLTYDSNKSALLNYDPESDTYELLDEDGNEISEDIYVNIPLVTDAPESSETTATTVTTVSTTKYISPAGTVPPYVGRLRAEIISERALLTTTTTAKTTVKTTVKTTAKTTTKATTTTKARYDGIDVSRYQGSINWKKVKAAGIDFVMIRAGYGMEYDQVDANFHTNIKNAQAAGLECGVYWYSYAVNTSEALKEAKVCYNTIKGYKLSYPVAFDIEDPSQTGLSMTTISNITKVFCNYMESQKYYVSVYSYVSFLKDKMNSSVYSRYDMWIAHTGVSTPSYSHNYGMWQYSHTGRVNGISGNVDLDYGYKNYPTIMKSKKLNGYK